MGLQFRSPRMLVLLIWFFWRPGVESQSYNPETKPARALDVTLQEYAFRAFVHPRTGIPFEGIVPPYLTGIEISAMRLRSGSLFHRGVQTYEEFRIPIGLREQPYVERLVLVYQNLGNWSTTYYPLPGYVYLTPILGLLAYNASDLSATNLPELDLWASDQAIRIKFRLIRPVPNGLVARCVWFDLHGQVNFTDLVSSNECLTFEQGHFSIVVESTAPPEPVPPAPPEVPTPSPKPKPKPKGNESRVWPVVGSLAGGMALLVLLALLILWGWRYKKRKRMRQLERAADAGEALRMTRVGSLRAPFAMGTRTMPHLESDFAV